MRIAVVWNHGTPLSECSFRFEEYIRGLEELGHEAFVVCPQSSDDGFPVPTFCPPLGEGLGNREFWLDLKVQVAILPSFHQMSGLLKLLVGLGVRTIAMGDSDGQMGLRAFPLATMSRTVYAGIRDRSERRRQLGKLAFRYLRSFQRRDPQDAEFLRSTRYSDVLTLGNEESRGHFRRFLRKAGAEKLAERVRVVPLAINRVFCEFPDLGRERRGLVAVGRWGDPQKNAPLLARALARYLECAGDDGDAPVNIFAAGGEEHFRDLCRNFPNVTCQGAQHPPVLAEALAGRRSIVFSSRWEGSLPHAAREALAVGATIVGTPIPGFRGSTEDGAYGRVASAHRVGPLARAIAEEQAAWRRGERDPASIAAVWRERSSGRGVCQAMLAALGTRASCPHPP